MSKESGGARRHWNLVAGAMLVILLSLPAIAEARSGSLDPSFGEGGQVLTSVGGRSSRPEMAIAPGGGIVLRNGYLLARFLPEGARDLEFGQNGSVVFSKIDGMSFEPSTVTVDREGRILFFGAAVDYASALVLVGLQTVPVSWAAVLRLSADGGLDPGFGGGKGFIRSDFGIPSDPPAERLTVRALAGTVDAQGRPLLVAGAAAEIGGCVGHTRAGRLARAVVRLSAAGDPDPAFGGGDGIAPLEGLSESPAITTDVSEQPLVVTHALRWTGCSIGSRVLLQGVDGAPLSEFGSGGSQLYRGLSFSLLAPSGALILFDRRESAVDVLRTRPDGRLDRRFGRDGKAEVRLPAGTRRTLRPVALDSQGRILLVGSVVRPRPARRPGAVRSAAQGAKRSYIVVTRLSPSGRTDLSFGKRGWVMTPVTATTDEVIAQQAALDSQGRLVVAGSAVSPGGLRGDVLLVRYLLGS